VTFPSWLFGLMLWSAVGLVALGAIYLLVVLVREWMRQKLW
jgi:hypothetical protein